MNRTGKSLLPLHLTDVQRATTAFRRDMDLGVAVQRGGRVRLGDCLADWLKPMRANVKPLTHARYGELLRHLSAATPGKTMRAKVTPAQLERLCR